MEGSKIPECLMAVNNNTGDSGEKGPESNDPAGSGAEDPSPVPTAKYFKMRFALGHVERVRAQRRGVGDDAS